MNNLVAFVIVPLIVIITILLIVEGRRRKRRMEKQNKIKLNGDAIFDVTTFNKWFQDPDNRAVYANKGIFLRIDKLSESHIYDYLAKMFGVVNVDEFEWETEPYVLIHNFHEDVRNDWKNKLKEINKLSEKF